MFDIGFSELVVIGLVALIVIGPERMPVVARTLGALLGRAQRYVNDVKSEIRRELHVEDMKKFEERMRDEVRQIEDNIDENVKAIEHAAQGAPETPPSDAQEPAATAAADDAPIKPVA